MHIILQRADGQTQLLYLETNNHINILVHLLANRGPVPRQLGTRFNKYDSKPWPALCDVQVSIICVEINQAF